MSDVSISWVANFATSLVLKFGLARKGLWYDVTFTKTICFSLRVRELLAALGHNIGLEPTVLCDLDLEQLVTVGQSANVI